MSTVSRLCKRAHEQARADQQQQRDRDLRGDQRLAQPRLPPPSTLPAWSFSVGATSGRVDCSAGARPNSTPVSVETAEREREDAQVGRASRPAAGASGADEEAEHERRAAGGEREADQRRRRTRAAGSRPAAAARGDGGVAPSARRTAISRCRPAPRASSRLATLAHAMSSTPAAMAISTHSGGSASRRKLDRPCALGHDASRVCDEAFLARGEASREPGSFTSISSREREERLQRRLRLLGRHAGRSRANTLTHR